MVSNNSIIIIILAVAAIAVAITVHEFMHGLVGYWLGDDTAKASGRLSLNPVHHIDPITTVALPIILILIGLPPFGAAKPVPVDSSKLKFNEFGMALVAIAGPFINLILAVLGGIVLRLTSINASEIWTTWWWLFISINVGFFVFNMIPFPPLDGSRVLYAFAPEPLQKLMMQLEAFGLMAIALLMFFIIPLISNILQSINTAIIGLVLGT